LKEKRRSNTLLNLRDISAVLNRVEVIKAGILPRHDELDNLLRDLPFPEKDPEDFVLKDLFQGLRVQCRGHLERSASIESAIGAEYVAMGVEIQEIPKVLDRYDCPGSCHLFFEELIVTKCD
jgi:hypothetical protein